MYYECIDSTDKIGKYSAVNMNKNTWFFLGY